MRMLTFRLNKAAHLQEPELPIPEARMSRLRQSFRRRLDDDLQLLFERACATGQLDAAADLLAVMEKWHVNRQVQYGRERRINDTDLCAMRRELQRRVALRN